MFTAARYLQQLQALLPTGPAWPRDPEATLTKLLAAWAVEFARVDARMWDLVEEADPRTTYAMLADWERTLGLPDACSPALGTIQERRPAVFQKLAVLAGQTPDYYIAVAAALGFEVEIIEFDPDVDEYDETIDITDGRWRFVWRMNVLTQTDFTVFRAGVSAAGDRLREGGATDLECVISAARPAHTHVIFSYPEP